MTNLIIIGVVLLIVLSVTLYIVKAKKRGTKCIGCPHGGTCAAGKNGSCCGSCAQKQN